MIQKSLVYFFTCIVFMVFFSCQKNAQVLNPVPPTPPPPAPVVSSPVITQFSPASASIDSVITITGTNFNARPDHDSVKFNGVLATVKSASATQLLVTVPAGATTGKITVTVGTQTGTSTNDFTVLMITDQWISKADFWGTYRTHSAAFAVGKNIYVAAGQELFGNKIVQDVWEYNTTYNYWTQKADFSGGPANNCIGLTIGNKGYISMYGNSGTNSFWQYDTASDHWTRKADFPGYYRFGPVAFGIGNKGYLGLGALNGVGQDRDFWEYDPSSDAWTGKAAYPGFGSMDAAYFVLDNNAYVGTGWDGANTSTGSKDFWQYSPATDVWTKKADFVGEGRSAAAGFAIGDKGYIGTGNSKVSGYLSDFWQYDPSQDSWLRKADLKGGARYHAFGISCDNKGYFSFGTGTLHNIVSGMSDVFIDLWQYSP